jgi:hypothetical protein
LALTLATAALAACGSDGGSQDRTGTLKLGITDGPVDAAEAVVVQFTGVELKRKGGPAFTIDFLAPKTLDLIELQGLDRAMLLDGEEIPAGEYEWMRLLVQAEPNVDDSSITIDGATCELQIPSGAETGLKMIRGFTIGVGTITDFTVDFDLRKSVTQPPGQGTAAPSCDGEPYVLKPVLRLVDSLEVGAIAGVVDAQLMADLACGSEFGNVYLFGPYETAAPTPDDVDGSDADGADPITSAMVAGDGSNAYTIGFVPAGNYVAAYTCDADAPDVDADAANTPAGADEVVGFTPVDGETVTVVAGQTATLDFDAVAP